MKSEMVEKASGIDSETLRDWLTAGAVWSCLLVLPIGRLVEVPVLGMAAAGLVVLLRDARALSRRREVRLFGALFLCVWLPILLSLPGAVNSAKTASVAMAFPRFFLSGIFIVWALHSEQRHAIFLAGCAALLGFWVLDGLFEIVVGRDLFGFAPLGDRINGVFGHRTPKFSMTLAFLAPLLLEYARRRWSWWAVVAIGLPTIAVVIIAGTRSAWISTAILLAGYAFLYARPRATIRWRRLALAALLFGAFGSALYFVSPRFSARLDQTLAVFEGDPTPVNAIDHRFWIWRGALRMFSGNPINGVGARDFRYAYPDYALPDDPFVHLDPPILPTNSHQLLLEIGSETGIVGLIGLAGLCGLLLWAVAKTRARRDRLLRYGLCLLIVLFPLNTHLAFYSSFLSQLLWWLIALFCAAWGIPERPAPGSRTIRA